MRFPSELPVRRAICAGHAHACSPCGAQSSRRSGSSRRSLRHHTWHSGHAGQIARNHRQLEVLVDALDTAIDGLPDPSDGLAPAEMLFDSFADDLANPVARMPRSATVDCAAAPTLIVARDMRCHVASAAIVHEVAGVIRLVGANCLRMSAWHAIEQLQRAGPLGETIRVTNHGADHQPRAILHQDVPVVAQNGRAPVALLEQSRLRISSRLVRGIATLLAFPVSVGVAATAGWRTIVRAVLAAEALVTGPRLDQRAVHRVLLVV